VSDRCCLLCSYSSESQNHIFFECAYSRGLWQLVLGLCSIKRSIGMWLQEFNWATSCLKSKSFFLCLLKLVWNAVVYFIWCERNSRLFENSSNSVKVLLEKVKDVVRFRLSSRCPIDSNPINNRLCLE
ncbi:hypothetical protein ES288_D03G060300v1, partial [Gossypium darwinii]